MFFMKAVIGRPLNRAEIKMTEEEEEEQQERGFSNDKSKSIKYKKNSTRKLASSPIIHRIFAAVQSLAASIGLPLKFR